MRYTSLVLLLAACRLAAQDASSASIDWSERWNSYLQKTYSWKKIGWVVGETAFDQTFRLNKCGRPPYCLPHEIGGALAERTARTSIEFGAGAILREDLRRSPSNLKGFRRRVAYAFIHAPLAKNSEGDWEPAYSRFAGTLGSAAVSAAWRGRPITAPRLFEHFGWSLTSYLQDSLWTEFEPDLKRAGVRFFARFRHSDTKTLP